MMKHGIGIALLLLLGASALTLCACVARKHGHQAPPPAASAPDSAHESHSAPDEAVPTPGYRQITMEEAADIMERQPGYTLLDVRRPDEFAAGHIPGAINLPNESIKDTDIPSLPQKDALILVYCRSGRRSKQAAEKLVKLGYTNIVECGGIQDWKGEIET